MPAPPQQKSFDFSAGAAALAAARPLGAGAPTAATAATTAARRRRATAAASILAVCCDVRSLLTVNNMAILTTELLVRLGSTSSALNKQRSGKACAVQLLAALRLWRFNAGSAARGSQLPWTSAGSPRDFRSQGSEVSHHRPESACRCTFCMLVNCGRPVAAAGHGAARHAAAHRDAHVRGWHQLHYD